jgi:hypothetical protein
MPIFAIIKLPTPMPTPLGEVISTQFPDNFLQLTEGHAWLIATTGTAIELSGKLGITDGTNGSAMVLEVGTYYGRGNPTIWTWIKSKWEAVGSG